ncbi:pilus assembly protein TadG-related protein [Streptomyces sp. NPDC052023]|uniref:pilus assembly protein TadG-related protein n=1 Tax=Streptomyces sp. NPDC052023 TaxID=3365681 RepID=UPI0037D9531C
MTRLRRSRDAGQAFPIYITVVAGLLFLAFAYLAVGQAAATRSEAQTAADAAALAAAQNLREQLAGEWLENVLDPTSWQGIFEGDLELFEDPCERAGQLAAQNDAHVDDCQEDGPLGYRVAVTTDEPVGDTIVPGTENRHARAFASAVVERRCNFELPGEEAGDDILPSLDCEGEQWDPDPEAPDTLPDPEDLFDVHLAD